jgi:hypothetical protein
MVDGAVQDDEATCYAPANTIDFACEDDDTVVVAVTFELTSTAAPTDDDADALKTNIADAVGVDESSIIDFDLTWTSAGRRRLLGSYTWFASFNVVVSLSETSWSSGDSFAAAVATALASDSFTSAVQSSTGATVDTSSITVTVVVDGESTSSSSSSGVNVVAIALFAIGGVVVILLVLYASFKCCCGNKQLAVYAAATVPARPTTTMRVAVPQGASYGETLHVQGPNDELLSFITPQGVGPGRILKIQVPALEASLPSSVAASVEMVVVNAVPTGNVSTNDSAIGFPPALFLWFEQNTGLHDDKISEILAYLCGNKVGAEEVSDLSLLDEEDEAYVMNMLPKIQQRKFDDALSALKIRHASSKKVASRAVL